MSRETVDEKAIRYLGEGRLRVEHVAGNVVRARCRGASEYMLGFGGGRWSCSCPARKRCCHLAALQLVARAPDERDT